MAIGAAAVLVQLVLSPVTLAGGAVLALVFPLVDVTLGIDAAKNLLHYLLVALLSGADEIIIGNAQAAPEFLKASNNLVHIRLRRHACFLCLLLYLLAVLIGAGQEKHVIPRQALETRNRIRQGRAVGMTDMQLRAWVVNRGGNVEWCLCHEYKSS